MEMAMLSLHWLTNVSGTLTEKYWQSHNFHLCRRCKICVIEKYARWMHRSSHINTDYHLHCKFTDIKIYIRVSSHTKMHALFWTVVDKRQFTLHIGTTSSWVVQATVSRCIMTKLKARVTGSWSAEDFWRWQLHSSTLLQQQFFGIRETWGELNADRSLAVDCTVISARCKLRATQRACCWHKKHTNSDFSPAWCQQ